MPIQRLTILTISLSSEDSIQPITVMVSRNFTPFCHICWSSSSRSHVRSSPGLNRGPLACFVCVRADKIQRFVMSTDIRLMSLFYQYINEFIITTFWWRMVVSGDCLSANRQTMIFQNLFMTQINHILVKHQNNGEREEIIYFTRSSLDKQSTISV